MVDTKPPRLDADERTTLLALLQYQRASLVRKVTGVDEEAATRVQVASGTSLAWLVEHMAEAETTWVARRFAGLASDDDRHDVPASCVDAVARYEATWARTDALVASAELDDTCRGDDTVPEVNLRWILAHLLEETARHAGHADILRELIDGETGR